MYLTPLLLVTLCNLNDREGEIGFGGSVVEPNEKSGGIDSNDSNECRMAENRDRNLELRPGLSGHQKPGVRSVYYSKLNTNLGEGFGAVRTRGSGEVGGRVMT